MVERAKVIRALECCTAFDEQGFPLCEECPYADDGTCPELDQLHRDALETLKNAVPLDKLCEWLAAEYVSIPCHLCDWSKGGKCSVLNDAKTTCPSGADEWRKTLEKGMGMAK